jgi:putative component of toxin-antitoxin plasmid stabilization module
MLLVPRIEQSAIALRETFTALLEQCRKGHTVEISMLRAIQEEHERAFGVQVAEVERSLEAGNFTLLTGGHPPLPRIIQVRKEYAAKLRSTDFGERNLCLVAPLLERAIAGDQPARRAYEEFRLFDPSLLPEWGTRRLSELVPPGEIVEFPVSQFPLHLWPFLTGPFFLERQGWRACIEHPVHYFSFAQSKRDVSLLALIREISGFDDRFQLAVLSSVLRHEWSPSMIDPMPWAKSQERNAELFVASAFASRILEDARTVLDLPVDDDALARCVSITDDPWSVLSTRFTKFVEIRDLVRETPELETSVSALLIAKRPTETAKRLLKAQVDAGSTVLSAGADEPETGPNPARHHAEERAQMIAALKEAIAIFSASEELSEARHALARQISALVRRGAASYGETIEALRSGVRPSELVSKLRSVLRPTAIGVTGESGGVPPPEELESPVVLNQLYVSAEFMESLSHLQRSTPRVAYKIRSRLNRLRDEGYGGDTQNLKNRSDLYELRIHSGPGYRVIFTRPAPRVFQVLALCTKNEQIATLDRCDAILREGHDPGTEWR